MRAHEPRDWAAVMDRLIEGDPLALAEASGMVSGLLRAWRAYDLRDDWEDLAQDVLATVARDFERDRIREKRAVGGYIRTVARRRLVDVLRQRRPEFVDFDPDRLACSPRPSRWDGFGLREQVARLPERQRAAIEAVYLEGLTQEEAASCRGMPLGSLKRHLRHGLAALRAALAKADC